MTKVSSSMNKTGSEIVGVTSNTPKTKGVTKDSSQIKGVTENVENEELLNNKIPKQINDK